MNQLQYEKQFTLPRNRTASAACVVPAYEGMTVTRPEVELGKREVELEVNRHCVAYAEYLPVSDSAAYTDYVRMDFIGYLDGQPFDDGKVEDFEFQLGSNTFVEGFERQIAGHCAGETFDISVTFPAEYPAEELQNKECTFTITLHEVRHLTPPAPSDEIAQKEGYADLAEMQEAIRQHRIALHRAKDDETLKNELLERLIASTEVVISQPLMEFTVDLLRRQLEQSLAASKVTMERHLQRQHLTEQMLEEQLRQRASNAIAKQLVVSAITEWEGLEPAQQEIDKAVEEYIQGAPRANLRQRSPQLSGLLRERLCCHKVSNFLLDHAVEV